MSRIGFPAEHILQLVRSGQRTCKEDTFCSLENEVSAEESCNENHIHFRKKKYKSSRKNPPRRDSAQILGSWVEHGRLHHP